MELQGRGLPELRRRCGGPAGHRASARRRRRAQALPDPRDGQPALFWNNLDEKGGYKFNDEHRAAATIMLDELVFWSEHLKGPRAELAALKKQEES